MSSDLDLLYSDVEDDLRSSVRDLLADRCDPTVVVGLYDGDRSLVDALWKPLAVDLGLTGLLVPEDQQGAGATAREAAVVLEELGRAVAPVPFLTSSVVATTLLLEADGDLLPRLATGERTAALVVPLNTAPHGPIPACSVDAAGRLTGVVSAVAGALEADELLVPATDAGGTLSLHAVAAADVEVTPTVSLDMTRQLARIRLADAAGRPVLGDAEPSIRRALLAGAALLASEQLGIARWCLEETVAYLMQRHQFGRPLGGFQALKHRLADLSVGVESAAAAARYAAAAVAADDPDVPVAAALAQASCSDLAVTAAEEALQLHGGIGMTWEHPMHLYLKRAKADQIAFGTPGSHRARLAELVDLPGAGA